MVSFIVTSVMLSSTLFAFAGGTDDPNIEFKPQCGLVSSVTDEHEESPLEKSKEELFDLGILNSSDYGINTGENNVSPFSDPDAGKIDWSKYTTINK